MTMNDTWGFKSYDDHWKSTETLLRNLVDIVSKGGNYLLNVGPTAEGVIPQPSVDRLLAMGEWLDVNGEAVYGTVPGPIQGLTWCRTTAKPGVVYLHVFDWPDGGRIAVPGLDQVDHAYLLNDPSRSALPLAHQGDEWIITGPAEAPDTIDTVLVLTTGS
jgi:alpha-L-fucosidase